MKVTFRYPSVKQYLITLLILSVLLLGFTFSVLPDIAIAATSQAVTVNATPAYVTITNTPATWDLNGITGSGVVDTDTVYYSNPLGDTTVPSATVVDGECRFTGDDTGSTVNTDWTLTHGSFSGGDANMTNSDDGSNGATTYGAYGWYSGMTYASKVITKSAASTSFVTNHSAGSLKWGGEVETQTNAWAGGGESTSTLTLTVSAN